MTTDSSQPSKSMDDELIARLRYLRWAQPVARYAASGHSMALSDSR